MKVEIALSILAAAAIGIGAGTQSHLLIAAGYGTAHLCGYMQGRRHAAAAQAQEGKNNGP